MKLSKLITQISPLPWKFDEPNPVKISDAVYCTHAANVLPGLVDSVRKIIKWHDNFPMDGLKGNCQCRQCQYLKPALSVVEEVKTRH